MRAHLHLRSVAIAIAVGAMLHVATGAAHAATLYVKVSGSDVSPNCAAIDPCRTINYAVSVAQSGDTIQVGVGVFSEMSGVHLYKDLTINGTGWFGTRVSLGWFVASGFCCSVFDIGVFANVTLRGMTISDGYRLTGAGINNQGILTLDNVLIWQNLAHGNIGAALENSGELTMTNSAISHNNAPYGFINGPNGVATLTDVRVTDTYGGPPSLSSAGIGNQGGTLTIDRGLIAGNHGPGLRMWTPAAHCAEALLTNVTISGNSRGGVEAYGGPNCGGHELTLKHMTVAANTAKTGTGGLYVELITVNLENSILAANSGPQCGFNNNIAANVIAYYSLIGDNSCNVQSNVGSLFGVDPQLTKLSYPGHDPFFNVFHLGATKVHKLKAGSPAIDSAALAYCTAIDQLGTLRPIDGDFDGDARCDMGAYEYRLPTKTEN